MVGESAGRWRHKLFSPGEFAALILSDESFGLALCDCLS